MPKGEIALNNTAKFILLDEEVFAPVSRYDDPLRFLLQTAGRLALPKKNQRRIIFADPAIPAHSGFRLR
jgi:hypothetical protein